MAWLINAAQLEKFRKSQKNIIILDATWYLPSETGNAYAEFIAEHISGARFFDLSLFIDKENPLPNMLTKDENKIADLIGKLGITNDHKIIFYDNSKQHTSCRALWMFKVFGHNPNQLYILNGNINAWKIFGGKLEAGEPKPVGAKPYKVNYQNNLIRNLEQMKANVQHPTEQVIDARNALRYAGARESKPGIRSGHIPGSFCFPFTSVFESDGTFKPIEKTKKLLSGLGIDLTLPIITTCGSGTTAPILNFVLDLIGTSENAMYDGSWSEWGADKLYPGEQSIDERPVVTSLDT